MKPLNQANKLQLFQNDKKFEERINQKNFNFSLDWHLPQYIQMLNYMPLEFFGFVLKN